MKLTCPSRATADQRPHARGLSGSAQAANGPAEQHGKPLDKAQHGRPAGAVPPGRALIMASPNNDWFVVADEKRVTPAALKLWHDHATPQKQASGRLELKEANYTADARFGEDAEELLLSLPPPTQWEASHAAAFLRQLPSPEKWAAQQQRRIREGLYKPHGDRMDAAMHWMLFNPRAVAAHLKRDPSILLPVTVRAADDGEVAGALPKEAAAGPPRPALGGSNGSTDIKCDTRGSQASGQVNCPKDCKADGSTVWGTGPYTADSSVCRAAIYQGLITDDGGPLIVSAKPGESSYSAGNQNGVQTTAYAGYSDSFTLSNQCTWDGNEHTGDVFCPPGCAANGKTVWGTGPYTGDSSICKAAIYQGLIGDGGGAVHVTETAGRSSYGGSGGPHNGVATREYAHAYPRSFTLSHTCGVTSHHKDGDVYCPPGCAGSGAPVWGTGPFSGASSICKAAIYAGLITNSGGQVHATKAGGRSAFSGGTRNGVTTEAYGSYPTSFRLTDTCNVTGMHKTGEVRCPAHCAQSGRPVWGTGPYTHDSSVCKAAIHQGLISDAAGGKVHVALTPGRDAYGASTKNGVQTLAYGRWGQSLALADACATTGNHKTGVVHCPAGCKAHGAGVWGRGPYTSDSSICKAAIYQGLIPDSEGFVQVKTHFFPTLLTMPNVPTSIPGQNGHLFCVQAVSQLTTASIG